ncbi:tyrosine kinase receptor Cad96Ca-like [Lingula anatina]|uniref:Tyrosine kinase receptor Cad96Ca-like n=1 Tax=Lingula anatina TaxID=7574 RepID=A0A2R2MTD9_LINAN|nr:tyrosine kinase receptor Cad96Ca-like [Lingula anatina]|eukprot:XP_023933531.1 tyrosine kinase receptor Cad96Ca-like [Lingula anatina]
MVFTFKIHPYAEVNANSSARELSESDLRILGNIGHGHFGEVYKAVLKTTDADKFVAVKLLKEKSTEVDKKEFFRELETMQLVPQHENVVAMLGYCKTAARAFLVLEYLGNGNLKTYLRKSRSNNIYGNLHGGSGKLTSQDLLSFALGSASGMAHIAKYKFLHRDLAARNILVSDTMVCKVSDFGLARDVIDSREYLSRMETPLPIRWMAPESISDSVYTTKSDVWSFGVLLWEIVTLGATPYPGITSGRELIREIRSGYRMEKPQHCTQELYNMMMMCWEEEPTERPTFDNLVTSLRDMANEEMKLHVDVDRAAEAIYCDIDSQLVGEIV